ncbi:hypothetical protein OZN62_12355 [Aurantiacibacter sp. MUD11]|uniref:hypothetical protein n=1 Tax=Aurantiacibacter sp. MUD11 TaxID=3003265 RepID=UPI0022AAB16C|nr:hypothetical protein [Aurantiacibacter sp. MUD11]WAT17693.1 hypothetical protein OZN62_12355 [Aurantiacibacter sp. MUD11]
MAGRIFVTDGNNVLRKYALFVGVAALGALVTSCGGDDTGTPTPTPTSTETPTPTPSPAIDFDLMDDFETQAVNANYAFAYFTPDAGGDETFNGASRLNGTSTISLGFSPESVTFTFPDLNDPVTFDDGDFVSGTATRREYARGDEGLVLELPFAHILRVTYEFAEAFTRDTTDGTLRGNKVTIFFNQVTTEDDLTVDINYTGNVQVAGGDPANTLSDVISSPQVTFTVDASEGTVNGTIEIYEDIAGVPTLVGTLVFDGALNANGTFQGTLEDTANDLVGAFAGAISGPNREELFILFSASGDTDVDADDDRRYVGSFIGAD